MGLQAVTELKMARLSMGDSLNAIGENIAYLIIHDLRVFHLILR